MPKNETKPDEPDKGRKVKKKDEGPTIAEYVTPLLRTAIRDRYKGDKAKVIAIVKNVENRYKLGENLSSMLDGILNDKPGSIDLKLNEAQTHLLAGILGITNYSEYLSGLGHVAYEANKKGFEEKTPLPLRFDKVGDEIARAIKEVSAEKEKKNTGKVDEAIKAFPNDVMAAAIKEAHPKNDELEKANKEIVELKEKVAAAERATGDANAELEAANARATTAEKRALLAETRTSEAKTTINGLIDQLELAQQKARAEEKKFDSANAALQTAETEKLQAQIGKKEAEAALETANAGIKTLEQRATTAEEGKAQAEQRITSLKAQVSTQQSQIIATEKRATDAEEQLTILGKDFEKEIAAADEKVRLANERATTAEAAQKKNVQSQTTDNELLRMAEHERDSAKEEARTANARAEAAEKQLVMEQKRNKEAAKTAGDDLVSIADQEIAKAKQEAAAATARAEAAENRATQEETEKNAIKAEAKELKIQLERQASEAEAKIAALQETIKALEARAEIAEIKAREADERAKNAEEHAEMAMQISQQKGLLQRALSRFRPSIVFPEDKKGNELLAYARAKNWTLPELLKDLHKRSGNPRISKFAPLLNIDEKAYGEVTASPPKELWLVRMNGIADALDGVQKPKEMNQHEWDKKRDPQRIKWRQYMLELPAVERGSIYQDFLSNINTEVTGREHKKEVAKFLDAIVKYYGFTSRTNIDRAALLQTGQLNDRELNSLANALSDITSNGREQATLSQEDAVAVLTLAFGAGARDTDAWKKASEFLTSEKYVTVEKKKADQIQQTRQINAEGNAPREAVR